MKNYVWKSSVAPMIQEYLEFNHLAGLKFERQERCMQHFDHYFYYSGYEGKAITKEILWPFIYEQDEADSTISMKEALFSGFSRFLGKRGYHAYVIIPQHTVKRSQYIPHIYTKDEIKRFLAAIDSFPDEYTPERKIIDPVMFRVIIGTGCRLSEVLNLKTDDFDREAKALRILHAKNDRSRIVPLCNSLSERLDNYICTFHSGETENGVLFPGKDGAMDKSTAYRHFRDYLFLAGIPHTAGGPRIHDFRHTAAVENLRRWSEEGKDLFTMLPYLSAYMGHSDFRATQYYLRLTAEAYPKLVKQMEDLCWNIIPEGGCGNEG